MIVRFLFVVIFTTAVFYTLYAQTKYTSIRKKNYTIHYESPIRKILLYAPRNILKTYYAEEGYPIYKILIVSTRNRYEAMNIEQDLKKIFINQPVNIIFREPNYKVTFGFFKLREDAEIELVKLNRYFLNQRPLVIFSENEPISKVDSIFSLNKNFVKNP